MNPYLGMIFAFGGNFAISSFAMCNGQLLAINQNTALFSILGTTYGGNGTTTFALPDLRGRALIHQGNGPGLSPYVLGQAGGAENQTLLTGNLPVHSHSFNVNAGQGGADAGSNAYLADGIITGSGPNASPLKFYTTAASNVALGASTIGSTGSNLPFSIITPYATATYLIALEGIFPSRS